MLRRTLAIVLSLVALGPALGRVEAQAQTTQTDAQRAERARADVSKAGVGEKARVEVRLRDETRIKGYVSQAGQDSFTVTDAKTGAARTVAYADAERVRKQGGGLSPRAWIIVGAAAAAAVIVAVTVAGPALCDGGAGC